MTDFYLSPNGVDTNDGLSWATARLTHPAAAAIAGPGDTIYVSHLHNEIATTTRTITSAGVPGSPIRILCVQDGVYPPVALAESGKVTAQSTANLALQGSFTVHGMTFQGGSNTNLYHLLLGTVSNVDVIQVFQKCTLISGSTNSGGAYIQIGSSVASTSSRSRFVWKDCPAKISSAAGRIEIYQDFLWRGGALLPGAATSYLMRVGANGRTCRVEVDGVDLSEMGVATDLVSGPLSNGKINFRNCTLPVGWTGQPVQGLIDPSLRVSLYNCDVASSGYPELTGFRMWIMTFAGSIRSDTAVLKTGGSSDGVSPGSMRMASNGSAAWYSSPLEADEVFIWNDKGGSPITVAYDILSDGALLTNADAWLELQILGAENKPLSSFVSGRAGLLEAPTAHPVSSAVWTGAGSMASPRKQRLSITVTPQEAGPMLCRVMLGKPNTTMYVDPKRVT